MGEYEVLADEMWHAQVGGNSAIAHRISGIRPLLCQ